MYTIKTNLSVIGTLDVSRTLNVQGSAVFASTIRAQDVNFQNATFNNIVAGGVITSSALNSNGDINVTGNIIGSSTSNATLNSISSSNVQTNNLTSTGLISSHNIINTEQINTGTLISNDEITTNVLNSTDINNSGVLNSDTIVNSNSIGTKDLTITGITTAGTVNSTTLTNTGDITTGSLISDDISSPSATITSLSSSSISNSDTITSLNITSTGVLNSTNMSNTGTISTLNLISTGTNTVNNIVSNNITNSNNLSTQNLTSTGVATTSSIVNSGTISTQNLTSSGLITANNITSTGVISSVDLINTGTLNVNAITAGEINSGNITSTGALQANSLQINGDITSTGTITGANVISVGNFDANSASIHSLSTDEVMVDGDITSTGTVQSDMVSSSFFKLGNSLNSAYSNNIAWIMNTTAVSPAWEGLSLDGSTVQPLSTKVYSNLQTVTTLGSLGTGVIDLNSFVDNTTARVVFSTAIVPAEDYTGVLSVKVRNETSNATLVEYDVDVVLTTDVEYKTTYDSPLWVSNSETVLFNAKKEDGTYLKVRAVVDGTKPFIKSTMRSFTNSEVFNTSNINRVVDSIDTLTGDDRLDAYNLKNIEQFSSGTYMGAINFANPVTQFNGAIKGSNWVALTTGVLDGITFGVGDLLISKAITPVVTTINDSNLFIVKPNPNPLATTTTPGIVIAGNGIAVDGSGHISTKLGLGVAFDSSFNVIADVANIDVTQLKNFNSLQKGTFRGLIPATLAELAGSVRGDFWKASTSGTIGTQAYNAGDELYCNVDTPTAPTTLANFTYVPQTTSSMIGATASAAGVAGIVPSPAAGDNTHALFGDATYKTVIQPTDIVDNLLSTSIVAPLSANQGLVLNTAINTKANTSDIVDNLLSSNPLVPLSANQGSVIKGLLDTKVNITDINNTLTSSSTVVPLSANQGLVLSGLIGLKLDKADVLDTLTSTLGTKALSANQGFVLNGLINLKVNTSDIIDNLLSTNATVPLSANQGSVINSMIQLKSNIADIVDNTLSTSSVVPLSANQGRLLKNLVDTKVAFSDIIDSLSSSSSTNPLSANQGLILNNLINLKSNILDIVDALDSTNAAVPLSANQGRVLKTQVDSKINTSDVVNNLTSTSTTTPLSANQGRVLENQIITKSNISDIVDSLTSNSAVVPLSANQGRVLKALADTKVNISDVVNNLLSTSATNPLSANQGNILNAAIGTKINTSDIVNNLTSTSTVFPLSANQGLVISNLINTKVNTADIVDNLLSNSATVPLSANQGSVLNTAINTKQATLVSGTNIKTINGVTVLGSGNIITNNDATASVKGVIQLAGDLSGTSAAPTVVSVNGITHSGTPATGSVLIATSSTAASWQSQTALAAATTTVNGLMSSSDKVKLNSLNAGNFVGSTSSVAGTAGQVPAPSTADSYNHILRADGSWGGINNAGRVSSYNTVTRAATATFAVVQATGAMTLTGNSGLYTGNINGIACTLAGLYKVTITTHMTSNGSVYCDASVGVNSVATGAVYQSFAPAGLLTGNDRNTISFTEIVSVGAGQTVSMMFRSTSTASTCTGATIIVEKLD